MTSIVYFGTHENAATILEALATTQGFTILGVVTQMDRPAGRGHKLTPSPVSVTALQHGLTIWPPETLRDFTPPAADVYVVCAYGLIIPRSILDKPRHGALNLHYSVLPRYRGASPFQTALLNGETATGITIMLMDEQMDHGPILVQEKIAIGPDDTAEQLSKRLNTAAIPLLLTTIPAWVKGNITPVEQDHSAATYCQLFTRADGQVDWTKSATEIYNQYRGLTPWPGIWTKWEAKRLKLLKIKKSMNKKIKAGEVKTDGARVHVGCADGAIEIVELQLEGKKAMDAKTFLNGFNNFIGATLG